MSCGAAGKVTLRAERAVGQLRSSSADSHRLQQALGRGPELQRLFLPRKPLTLPWKRKRILQPSAQATGILPCCPSRSDLGSRTLPYWTFLQSYFFCKAGWYSSAKGEAPGSHGDRGRLGGSWDGARLRAAAQHRALPGAAASPQQPCELLASCFSAAISFRSTCSFFTTRLPPTLWIYQIRQNILSHKKLSGVLFL